MYTLTYNFFFANEIFCYFFLSALLDSEGIPGGTAWWHFNAFTSRNFAATDIWISVTGKISKIFVYTFILYLSFASILSNWLRYAFFLCCQHIIGIALRKTTILDFKCKFSPLMMTLAMQSMPIIRSASFFSLPFFSLRHSHSRFVPCT